MTPAVSSGKRNTKLAEWKPPIEQPDMIGFSARPPLDGRSLAEHLGQRLVAHVAEIGLVPADALLQVGILAEEGLVVDAVERPDLDAAGVDEVGKRGDRAGILVLEEAAARGREHDDRPAGMAVALVFHVAAEMVAAALVVGDLHRSGLFRVDEVDRRAQRRAVLRPHLVGVVSHGLAEDLLDRLMVDDLVAVGG